MAVKNHLDSLGGTREAGKDQLDSLGGTREAGKDQLDSLRGTREAGKNHLDSSRDPSGASGLAEWRSLPATQLALCCLPGCPNGYLEFAGLSKWLSRASRAVHMAL